MLQAVKPLGLAGTGPAQQHAREPVGRTLDVTATAEAFVTAVVPGFAGIAVIDDVLRGSVPVARGRPRGTSPCGGPRSTPGRQGPVDGSAPGAHGPAVSL
ncbi:hypothetical protein GCM10010381_08560 [Streptomyces xantholiticus]|nr:hypothetical protein GCM10010381_08560 [Streptomyces xantholiticus]